MAGTAKDFAREIALRFPAVVTKPQYHCAGPILKFSCFTSEKRGSSLHKKGSVRTVGQNTATNVHGGFSVSNRYILGPKR